MTLHLAGLDAPSGRGPRRRSVSSCSTLSRRALESEGFAVVDAAAALASWSDGRVLVTGEVDRTTDFERGMPPSHQAWDGGAAGGGAWRHDPLVLDDQALVVHVRVPGARRPDRGGHAGAVNVARHAMRLTGVRPAARAARRPAPVRPGASSRSSPRRSRPSPSWRRTSSIPGHSSGWRAQQALAAALPDAFVPSSAGTRYTLAAA